MRLTADDLKGLRKLYRINGSVVWAYEHGGDTKFWARPHGVEPSGSHRDYPQYRLVGALDLVSGRVTGGQDEATPGRAHDRPDWWTWAEWAFKAFIGLCVISAFFILAIMSTFAGAGPVRRSRH